MAATGKRTSTRSKFSKLCIAESKRQSQMRIHRCAMRCLQDIIDDQEEESLPIAIELIFIGLADVKSKASSNRKRKNVYRADVEAFFAPPLAPEAVEELERECPAGLNAEKFHNVRKIPGMLVEGGKEFFMIDWEPSFEKRANLPHKMIVAFKKQHRMIVEKAYIDTEAVEAGRSKKRRTA